jgi:hypothetical protein
VGGLSFRILTLVPRLRLLILGLLPACIWTHASRAHPKPGAHADVRLSVDRDAVRVECLMNLRFVEQLVAWDRAVRDEIAPGEEPTGRRALEQYFAAAEPSVADRFVLDKRNRVSADGAEIRPRLAEFRVIRPTPEERPGFVDVAAAMLPQVLVKLEYPLAAPPRSVSFVWGAYPRDFQTQDRDLPPIADIEAVLFARGDILPIVFKETEPEYTWHAPAADPSARFLPVPDLARAPAATGRAAWLALVVLIPAGLLLIDAWRTPARRRGTLALAAILSAGGGFWLVRAPVRAPLPSPEQAVAIFEPLHANIYRAFDATNEPEIYDALARSVDGPLLASVYDRVYRSLVMHEEGGALSRVKALIPIDARADGVLHGDDGGAVLDLTASWRVEGVVYHWGHSHTRLNEYKASYRVESRPQGWRITAVEPLEQRRIQIEPEVPLSFPPKPAEGTP